MQIPHITLLKTLCLFFVIFCHALLPFDATNSFWMLHAETASPFAALLDSFMMPLLVPSFLFASGFLWELGMERKPRPAAAQVAGRVKRLLLPWLLMAVFWMTPLYTLLSLPVYNRPADTPFMETLGLALSGLFVDHLWFLLVLFWVTLFWIAATQVLGRGRTLAGAALALTAALLVENYGQGLRWYSLRQTSAPLLCFYLGMVVCRYRVDVDAWFSRRAFAKLGTLFVLIVLLIPQAGSAPAYWLTCCTACLFSYQSSLLLSRNVYRSLQSFSWYRYFEKNAFRYYLFHMPTGLLSFVVLDGIAPFPPVVFVPLSFMLTLAATTGLVAASRKGDVPLARISARFVKRSATLP